MEMIKKKSSSRFTVVDNWSLAEERALFQFLLHGDGASWISTKKIKFWESASEFVHSVCDVKRSTIQLDKYTAVVHGIL